MNVHGILMMSLTGNTTVAPKDCPQLEKFHGGIITADSMSWLELSSYALTPGTTVQIKCLVSERYVLEGPSTLTCQNNGTWSDTKPNCVLKPSSTTLAIPANEDDLNALPLIVISSLLGLLFICSFIIFAYVLYRKVQREYLKSYHFKQKLISSPATPTITIGTDGPFILRDQEVDVSPNRRSEQSNDVSAHSRNDGSMFEHRSDEGLHKLAVRQDLSGRPPMSLKRQDSWYDQVSPSYNFTLPRVSLSDENSFERRSFIAPRPHTISSHPLVHPAPY